MGGFQLTGPNYVFTSLPEVDAQGYIVTCNCLGYRGDIDADVEQALLQNPECELDLSVLPAPQRQDMQRHHLGQNMHYKIETRQAHHARLNPPTFMAYNA